jgi:hypothetical protein
MLPGSVPFPIDEPPVSHYTSGETALDIRDFVMAPSLVSLEPHRDDLLIIEGIDSAGGVGHDRFGTVLTGSTVPSISLDHAIADRIASDSRFRSLELGVNNTRDGPPVSYYAPGEPALAENSPLVVFERVFADVDPPDPAAFERVRLQRKSVLDAVSGQIVDLQQGLGQQDVAKLQNYLDSIRDVEGRLFNLASGVGCARPEIAAQPGDDWFMASENIPQVMNAQFDMLAMAMACDLTRVVTISFGKGGWGGRMPWLDINDTFHDSLGHMPDSDQVVQRKIAAADTWTAEQFAALIDRLKAIPEGDGTVFDNSVVIWTNELSKGNSHDADNAGYVLAGSAGGFFDTGRYVRYPRNVSGHRSNRNHGRWSNDLHVTLLHAMGIEADTFGDPAQFDGPLDDLKA